MNRILFSLLLSSLLVGSCNQDEALPQAELSTGSPTPIAGGGLTLNGFIGYISATDHGFTIYKEENSYPSKRISLGSPQSRGSFSAPLTNGLEEGVTYGVRSYMVRNGELTEGGQQPFVWTGDRLPELTDFFPKSGHVGDTITIEGRYFGDSPYVVFNGSKTTPALSSTDTHVKVVVPELELVTSRIELWQNTTETSQLVGSFLLEKPEIHSIDILRYPPRKFYLLIFFLSIRQVVNF